MQGWISSWLKAWRRAGTCADRSALLVPDPQRGRCGRRPGGGALARDRRWARFGAVLALGAHSVRASAPGSSPLKEAAIHSHDRASLRRSSNRRMGWDTVYTQVFDVGWPMLHPSGPPEYDRSGMGSGGCRAPGNRPGAREKCWRPRHRRGESVLLPVRDTGRGCQGRHRGNVVVGWPGRWTGHAGSGWSSLVVQEIIDEARSSPILCGSSSLIARNRPSRASSDWAIRRIRQALSAGSALFCFCSPLGAARALPISAAERSL